MLVLHSRESEGRIYGWAFLGVWLFCFGTPAALDFSLITVLIAAFGILLIVVPFYFCKMENLNFGDSLGLSVSRYASGCVPVTFLYIWIFVLAHFIYALALSVKGFLKGRFHSQSQWHEFVESRLYG